MPPIGRVKTLELPVRLPPLSILKQKYILNAEHDLRERHISLSHNLAGEEVVNDSEFLTWCSESIGRFPCLRDELSPYLAEGALDNAISAISPQEVTAFKKLQNTDPLTVMEAPESLLTLLAEINSILLEQDSFIRTTPMFTVRDSRNTRVKFPDINIIMRKMNTITMRLAKIYETCPMLSAIVLRICLTSWHLFSDGNGRMSRLIYSWIAGSATGRYLLLPIQSLEKMSDGGDIIKQRRASHHDSWRPVIEQTLSYYSVLGEFRRVKNEARDK